MNNTGWVRSICFVSGNKIFSLERRMETIKVQVKKGRVVMPKILIISHNPLTTYESMGKTFSTLLGSFASDEICQLYIYPTIPNLDSCNSYFRITDKDVLQSYYSFRVRGRIVEPNMAQSEMFENAEDEQLYRNPNNKKSSIMLARDLMWKCSRWYNAELKSWLEEQKPDCIFAAPGAAMFLYDIAMKISKELQIPIASYLCDEFYFIEETGTALRKERLRLLKKKIEEYMSKTTHVITICDELKDLYTSRFHRPMTTIMTGSSFPISKNVRVAEKPTSITYLGNIRCNRYKSIAEIGRALTELNSEGGTDYHINVYTGEKDKQILGELRTVETIHLKGFVSGKKFYDVLHNAEFLLHTESFEEDYIEAVKNSVSTKIADSLGSGVPLLAYGPSCIASMGHLIRNDCAITITEEKDLKSSLRKAFLDKSLREKKAKKGLSVAMKYHEPNACGEMVRQVFESITAQQ